MSHLRLFVALALAAAPALAGDHADFTIPWGSAPGHVARDMQPDPKQEHAGPESIRLAANGDLLVVDTRAHRVQRFTPAGKLASAVAVPGATEHDAERAIVDAAELGGELYLLELAERCLLRAGADGKLAGAVAIPAGESAILTALSTDGDHLTVFDGAENRVVRFDRAGKAAGSFSHELVQGLAPDGAGKWLGLELASPESCRGFKLWRVDAATGARQPLADVALPKPAVEVHLVGADRAGRAYVEVAHGAVESPTDLRVLVVGRDGKVAAELPVPPRPVEWRMLNARVVLPEGGLLTASSAPGGLAIRVHRLP